MRTWIRLACLLSLAVLPLGSGCSTTGMGKPPGLALGRPKVLPGVRTTTTVGDKPVSVVAGLPGESVAANTDFPERDDRADGRITGRVLDDRGRPVEGARVRLADGAATFGRSVDAVTDASGAFTLRGLRPGGRYKLIAESDGPDGRPIRLGQSLARAPETDARIRPEPADRPIDTGPPDDSRRIDTASSRTSLDDPEPDFDRDPDRISARPARINPDDLPPPAEADALESGSHPAARTALRGGGWRAASAEGLEPIDEAPAEDDIVPARSKPDRRSVFGLPVEDDDGPDPLPLAIERTPSVGTFSEAETAEAGPSVGALSEAEPAAESRSLGSFERAESPASGTSKRAEPTAGSPSVGTFREAEPFESASDPVAESDAFGAAAAGPDPAELAVSAGSETFAPAVETRRSSLVDSPSGLDQLEPAPPPSRLPEPQEAPNFEAAAQEGRDPANSAGAMAPVPSSAVVESPSAPVPAPDDAAEPADLAQPARPSPSPAAPEGFESGATVLTEPSVPIEAPDAAEPPATVETPADVAVEASPAQPGDDSPFTAAPEDAPEPADDPADPVGSFGEPSAVRDPADPEASGLRVESDAEPKATWKELTAQSAQRRAMQYPTSTRRLPAPVTDTEESRRGPLGLGGLARRGDADATGEPEVVAASCSYDERRKRLVDFVLPDLQGRPVRFQDLGADFILLDFWGTWCGPCLNAIPHLVQVQNRYDPKRIRVVGVAYERGTPEENASAVERTMRELGINYPVLMAEQDGRTCPLAAALNVHAYPTLVLIDRHGRILWRDTGAAPGTLARLDRVIAANSRTGVVRR